MMFRFICILSFLFLFASSVFAEHRFTCEGPDRESLIFDVDPEKGLKQIEPTINYGQKPEYLPPSPSWADYSALVEGATYQLKINEYYGGPDITLLTKYHDVITTNRIIGINNDDGEGREAVYTSVRNSHDNDPGEGTALTGMKCKVKKL